jgi:hypothetical protein
MVAFWALILVLVVILLPSWSCQSHKGTVFLDRNFFGPHRTVFRGRTAPHVTLAFLDAVFLICGKYLQTFHWSKNVTSKIKKGELGGKLAQTPPVARQVSTTDIFVLSRFEYVCDRTKQQMSLSTLFLF